ncbi:hypothetical protein JCM1840_003421 [Sporobolomyces johnsonii]
MTPRRGPLPTRLTSPPAAAAIVPDPPVPIQLTVNRIDAAPTGPLTPAPAPPPTPAAPARVPAPDLFVTPPPQPVFQREAAPSRESRNPLNFLSDPFVAQAVALMATVDEDLGTHDEVFSLPSCDPRNHCQALIDVDSAGWLDGEKGEFLSLLNDYKVFHPVNRLTIPPTAKILGGHFHYRRKGYGTTRALKVWLKVGPSSPSPSPFLPSSAIAPPLVSGLSSEGGCL